MYELVMITCLKCEKPLILLLDKRKNYYACKHCRKEYNLKLDNKTLIMNSESKELKLRLKGLSCTNEGLTNKTIYELYNKGVVKCTKTLNPEFNEHNSEWELSINKLREVIVKEYEDKKKFLKKRIESVNDSEEKYYCNKCNQILNFSETVKNNFLCNICNNRLTIFDIKEEIKMINSKLAKINNRVLNLSAGWC